MPVKPLASLFVRSIAEGEQAIVDDPTYLAHFGVTEPIRAGELWQNLLPQPGRDPALRPILEQGPLARRIVRAVSQNHRSLHDVYLQMCECLAQGHPFDPLD